MSRPILEVIALSAEDAAAAQAGGADRLEVVTDIAADGLTPALETFAAIREAVSLPMRVMLRLSDGFHAGGEAGIERLCERAGELRTEGAEEFVLGFLDDAGQADLRAVGALSEVIAGCGWTFHRAIDRAADRDALRKQLTGTPGLDAYLTAGFPTGSTRGTTPSSPRPPGRPTANRDTAPACWSAAASPWTTSPDSAGPVWTPSTSGAPPAPGAGTPRSTRPP